MPKALPLVSVIMPAYNAEAFIDDAISSVLQQTYENWELLIINDGSEDLTGERVKLYSDKRIQYFEQKNQGVSAARNVGLSYMHGDFFCFLDADDYMPARSIESRLAVFQKNEKLDFVDGKVLYYDQELKQPGRTYQPDFRGQAHKELLKLSGRCFLGNTWMIRRNKSQNYRFRKGLTHAEDLLFYLGISKGKCYDYTHEEILYYRQNEHSAMTNLSGLEEGYFTLYQLVKKEHRPDWYTLLYLKYKIIRIMVLSYLRIGKRPGKAIRVLFRYLLA